MTFGPTQLFLADTVRTARAKSRATGCGWLVGRSVLDQVKDPPANLVVVGRASTGGTSSDGRSAGGA